MTAKVTAPGPVIWNTRTQIEFKKADADSKEHFECGGQESLPHTSECPAHPEDRDVWVYRDRTMALLKRYARMSVETGRLPSLLGRDCFRARVTSYAMASFEDMVIFVHDVEMALRRLDDFQRQLIAMNVLEEYSQWEIARLLGCTKRWIEWQVPDAIDRLSQILLEYGLLAEMGGQSRGRKTCQGGEKDDFCVSVSKDGKNIF